MDKLTRFGEYAAKFEEVFANDQWSDLGDFFSEDAVYEVIGGGPFAGRHVGRDAGIPSAAGRRIPALRGGS
jgi:hypothetical protein